MSPWATSFSRKYVASVPEMSTSAVRTSTIARRSTRRRCRSSHDLTCCSHASTVRSSRELRTTPACVGTVLQMSAEAAEGDRSVWAGEPFPLGPEWDGTGTNFSLFSENAERVELCLFDRDGREE